MINIKYYVFLMVGIFLAIGLGMMIGITLENQNIVFYVHHNCPLQAYKYFKAKSNQLIQLP